MFSNIFKAYKEQLKNKQEQTKITKSVMHLQNLQDAAERDDAQAHYELAQLFESGNEVVLQDMQQAIDHYKLAAVLGNMDAQYYLATLYLTGKDNTLSSEVQKEKAVGWLKRAGEFGFNKAKFALINLYADRDAVILPKGDQIPFIQDEIVLRWCIDLATKENLAEAMYYLGVFYELGICVTPDLLIARQWYEKAKALNYAIAGTGYARVVGLLQKQLEDTSALKIEAQEVHMNKIIGTGGFGEVWQAEYKNMQVAVKKFTYMYNANYFTSKEQEREYLETSWREIQMMRKFNHNNIIKIFGAAMSGGEYFLVMEYMPNGDLFTCINSQNLTWSSQATLAIDIGEGLQYLHSQGYLHNDLKPQNVLIYKGSDNTLKGKLTDFGLSKPISQNSITNNKDFLGTLIYLAPEIMELIISQDDVHIGKPRYTIKSDVYSYSLVLWEMASRAEPFKELSQFDIPFKVAGGYRPEIPQHCHPAFAKLIAKCWAQRAEDRPNTEEVVNILRVECVS